VRHGDPTGGRDHFSDRPANGLQTIHARLQPGLHLLDDFSDAPGIVAGQGTTKVIIEPSIAPLLIAPFVLVAALMRSPRER
jgi:hypothetical protein